MNVVQVGPKPVSMTCPSCKNMIATNVKHVNSTKTHVFAFICCLLALWPCCWIPYCVDSCRNAEHYCPSCRALIGTYRN